MDEFSARSVRQNLQSLLEGIALRAQTGDIHGVEEHARALEHVIHRLEQINRAVLPIGPSMPEPPDAVPTAPLAAAEDAAESSHTVRSPAETPTPSGSCSSPRDSDSTAWRTATRSLRKADANCTPCVEV